MKVAILAGGLGTRLGEIARVWPGLLAFQMIFEARRA